MNKIYRRVVWWTVWACATVLTCAVYSQDTVHPIITGYPYVHDGDTIRVGQYWVRLWGVDAEELDEPNGIKSRDQLVRIIGTEQVICTLYEMSYRRHVGRCVTHTTGKDIGLEMIKSGYALDCRAYSFGVYRQFEPADARNKLRAKPYCEDKRNEGTRPKEVYRHA